MNLLIIKYILYVALIWSFMKYQYLMSIEMLLESIIVIILIIASIDYIFNNSKLLYFPFISKSKYYKKNIKEQNIKKKKTKETDDSVSLIDSDSLELIINETQTNDQRMPNYDRNDQLEPYPHDNLSNNGSIF